MKNADTGTFDSVFRQKPPQRDLKLLGAGENITLVELCVFLPGWLKHGDIAQRFWFDGLDRNHIVNILNWHCDLARDGVTPNLITNWMNKAMRRLTGDKKWTHKSNVASIDRSHWDPNNLTLTDCKLNIEHAQRKGRGSRLVAQRVPFRSLAQHVRQMLQGVDGLDLTRFVQYAKDHPLEELWFPQDFGYLVQKLGTVRVEKAHLGAEISKRWIAPVAKDQESQAAQMACHTRAFHPLTFGDTVTESSHRIEAKSSKQNISAPAADSPQDVVDSVQDAADTPCSDLTSLSLDIDTAMVECESSPTTPEPSHQGDFSTGLEDEPSLVLHEDLLKLSSEGARIAGHGSGGYTYAAAEALGPGPLLDNEDLDLLYDRYQSLLYLAVPEHVNPRIFERQW